MLLIVALVAHAAAACGGDNADADALSGTSPDPGVAGSANTAPATGTTLGWIVGGPVGTEFEFTETLTANGADTVNEYTYVIEDQPRQGLYTQFVEAATIEVTVTAGGPATVQVVLGTLAGDGFSVDVVSELAVQEAVLGATATVGGRLDGQK